MNDKRSEQSKVALVRCESYEVTDVKQAVDKGIELLGGLESIISPQDRVLLKPNLLSKHPPEDCVTTHPSILKAVAEKVLNYSDEVIYGDSPSQGNPRDVAAEAGLTEVEKDIDISYVDFEDGEDIFIDRGKYSRKFNIAREVLESDSIINLPKLKNHNLTRITGAIKNIFGCIPGFDKPELHLKLPQVNEFAKMLVELHKFIDPALHIMDGIMGMEGEGPGSGDPIPANVILFSRDPVAMDAVFSRLINLDPEKVSTNRFGQQLELGQLSDTNIKIVGEELESFLIKDFDVYRGMEEARHPLLKYEFLKTLVTRKPVIDSEKCIACGDCIQQCPTNPTAVSREKKNDTPEYDYSQCIRCFCCQEVCPEKAISIKKPFLRKLVDWFY